MRILTDTRLPSAYCPDGLAQALLPTVSRRLALYCAICQAAEARVSTRLPSFCGYRAAICLCCMRGAPSARRGVAILFLGHWHEIGLEGRELERLVRTRVPRRRERHRDCNPGVVKGREIIVGLFVTPLGKKGLRCLGWSTWPCASYSSSFLASPKLVNSYNKGRELSESLVKSAVAQLKRVVDGRLVSTRN